MSEQIREYVDVPDRDCSEECFALRVAGESMLGDLIQDGDIVYVEPTSEAIDDEIVIAEIDGESTMKRFYHKREDVELRSSNPTMPPMRFPADHVRIIGVVVGVWRPLRRKKK